jgi:hypothetical protein
VYIFKRVVSEVFSNLPLWKGNRRITDAETSVNSDAFIMGLLKMRVLNIEGVRQTHTK